MSDHEDGDQNRPEHSQDQEANVDTLQKKVTKLEEDNKKLTAELTLLKSMIGDDGKFPLSDRLKDEEYRNWIICTLSMTETKDVVGPIAEDKLKELSEKAMSELKESAGSTSDHAHTWDDVILSGSRNSKTLQMSCPVCDKVLKNTIIEQFVKPNIQYKYVQNNCVGEPWLDNYWVLAKAFLKGYPYIEDCKSTKQLDATALLDILMQWKMFEFPKSNMSTSTLYQKLKNTRNDLMHSPNNKVDTTTMKVNLFTLINWLNLWKTKDTCAKMIEKLEKFRNSTDPEELEKEVKESEEISLEIQKQSIEQDIEGKVKSGEDTAPLLLRKNKTEQILKEKKLETLDEQVKEKDKEIKQVKTKLDESQTENEEFKKKVTELTKEKETIVAEKSTVEKEKEVLQKENTDLEEKLKGTLQGQLEEEKKAVEQERKKLDQERKELEERVEQMKTSPEVPSSNKLYSHDQQIRVENLPSNSSEDYLTNYFESKKFDPLPNVAMVMLIASDKAIVTFEETKDVDIVLEAHKKEPCVLGEETLIISPMADEPENSEPLVSWKPAKTLEHHFDIVKVDPVVNDELHKKFTAKKEAMKNRSPDSEIAERSLWYCADDKAVLDNILQHGFDKTHPGLHDLKSGQGVYFADNVKQFSPKLLPRHEVGDEVFAIQAKVLIGNSCKGNESMTQLPDSNDSAVDDLESPTEYMIFDTDQACPLFLLSLKLMYS